MSVRRIAGQGAFVVIVGPDGVGKSGLARALMETATGESGYFHFRPPTRGRLRTSVPIEQQPATKNRHRPSLLLGWVRLALAFVRFWAGYVSSVRPMLDRGGLVIGDRWAYGYLVQPHALRYGGPHWLARMMIKGLPSPDLVVNLIAPPEEIHRRKQELTVEEIGAEMEAWNRVPVPRMVTLDALETSRGMAHRVMSELGL
jgi:thymidylate kinase